MRSRGVPRLESEKGEVESRGDVAGLQSEHALIGARAFVELPRGDHACPEIHEDLRLTSKTEGLLEFRDRVGAPAVLREDGAQSEMGCPRSRRFPSRVAPQLHRVGPHGVATDRENEKR